jgi:HD-like signal output (HDOD) protein
VFFPTTSTRPDLDELRRTVAAWVESGALELPVLPEAAQRVIAATRDETTDVRQLAALVTHDQSMAAHVLRMANSALYNTGVPIVSLQQAVARLGMDRVRQISLQVACQGSAFFVPGRMLEVRALFREALGAAFLTAEIARIRRRNVEEAYLCGLFHAVGKPILLQLLSKLEKQRSVLIDRETVVAIQSEFHTKTGAILIKGWGLPATLQESVLWHENPHAAPEASDGAMMTNLGAALARFALGRGEWSEPQIRAHSMIAPLNLYPEDVDVLLLHCEAIDGLIHDLS